MAIYTQDRRLIKFGDVLYTEVSFVAEMLHDVPEYNIYLYCNDAHVEDASELEFMNTMDLIVYVQVTHPWNYTTVSEYARENLKPPFLYLTWNRELQASNIIHYDYWIHQYYDAIYNWGRELYLQRPKRGIFSCLNNVAKAHRIPVAAYLLTRHGEQSLVTLNNQRPTPQGGEVHTPTTFQCTFREFCKDFDDQYVSELYSRLPISLDFEKNIFQVSFWTHSAYTEYYVNVATEHDFVNAFVSEKSMKPLLCEQIAIFVAGPGTVQILRDHGFDVFDDIIDHSYDLIVDPIDRMRRIFQVIDQVAMLDWPAIYEATKKRRKLNRLHGMKTDGHSKLRSDILNFIGQHVDAR